MNQANVHGILAASMIVAIVDLSAFARRTGWTICVSFAVKGQLFFAVHVTLIACNTLYFRS